VKLAQALVHDPDLLLLDEPTNGLDPRGREEMLALIRDLPGKRSCSILLSSHLLPDVEAVCESAILLAEGKVLFSGPIAEMRREDGNLYEVRVKAEPERLQGALGAAGCQAELHEGALQVRLPPGADTDVIFARALELGLQVRHLAPLKQTLEDAFLRILQAEEKEERA
jgi:ABC-2 type transport system ATP-binding protein